MSSSIHFPSLSFVRYCFHDGPQDLHVSETDLDVHIVDAVNRTGVTGYIAGDAIKPIYEEHPDFEYRLLVRTKEKADLVQKAYPTAKIILGDLDSSSLLEEEAANADIILHAADASDHEGAAKAIVTGLVNGHTKDSPGYWLHTGGTGILTFQDSENNFQGLGKWSVKQYNDLSGVDELTSLPEEAFHRNVDKIVLDAGIKYADRVKTVIVCPPTIYGQGRGPVSGRGRQAYELASLILKKGGIPVVGEGKARWNNVHIEDLSEVYRLLVNKAIEKDTNDEIWGAKGYMFTENGEHIWAELSRAMADKAKRLGYISDLEEYSVGKDEAMELAGFEAVSWGLNSRGKAERAKKYLGWKPTRPSIEDSIVEILEAERKRMSKS
ncbi:uncharacterized protein Z518_02608 [Rhinocladiella mackenziei CBS 650.93]|uniref:NAD-dependent epimerase/dehydratase domain-containing protein n=1 Tax=Rhinocladiella mackenziei CBS 650.93 TaxID=1442369 RepID=A0A0D2IPZ5_9EURO|nr:uncharacterized protein Z518_02608 [Rhinocladiella mackenziei CBS 650.93]KIX07954.1 hypothetical protein Z518_02608 [Rhinocladiella mackenziei CBS 650.93]